MNKPKTSKSVGRDWRGRVAEIGACDFENEEMLRLAFFETQDLSGVSGLEVGLAAYRQALKELAAVRRRLAKHDAEIADLRWIDGVIEQIRDQRTERLKEDRFRRRAQKEAEDHERRLHEPTYLGRRVSNRLRFEGGSSEKLTGHGIPVLSTFTDVAAALDLSPSALQWLIFERGAEDTSHYARFEIPKRSGGQRLISAPKPRLRAAQQWVRANVLSPLPVGSSAAAFRPGLSIVDNARRHSGKACVIRLDLTDFFASVTFPRVRGLFELLGYNPGVATVLALICTDAPRARVTLDGRTQYVIIGERSLPQGGCTSPDLCNLVTAKLDARLGGLAVKFGYTYSRYADDLMFSTDTEDTAASAVVGAVKRICRDDGFEVNHRKTRIMRAPNRQLVTGLLVNDGIRLTRADLRRIRAFLHRCETRGIGNVSLEIGKDAQAVAKGYFAYIFMVSPSVAITLAEKHPWI